MKVPRVSVIVPNYNYARFLGRRLDSILQQTFRDLELIYLDDASTDASKEVFAPYEKEPRVRAIRNTTNSGSVFRQWDKGVRQALGEYVWIAEADDYADEHLLDRLVRCLDENPDVGIAYCESIQVDPEDAVIGPIADELTHVAPRKWSADYVNSGREEARQFFAYHCTIPNSSAVLFRKTVYERVGGVDPQMKQCGDWMLWAKMLLVSDIAFVAEPLNRFRRHARSVTANSGGNGLIAEESYRVFDYLVRNIAFPADELDRACEHRLGVWLFYALARGSQIPWARQRRMYAVARRCDPRFHRRLCRKLAAHYMKRMLAHSPGSLAQVGWRRLVGSQSAR